MDHYSPSGMTLCAGRTDLYHIMRGIGKGVAYDFDTLSVVLDAILPNMSQTLARSSPRVAHWGPSGLHEFAFRYIRRITW